MPSGPGTLLTVTFLFGAPVLRKYDNTAKILKVKIKYQKEEETQVRGCYGV